MNGISRQGPSKSKAPSSLEHCLFVCCFLLFSFCSLRCLLSSFAAGLVLISTIMAISYTFPEEPPLKKSFVTNTVTEVSDSDEETPLLKSEDTQSCQARAHTEFEHSLDFWSALRVYRPAVFWCIIVNVTIVLNGFDGALMGNLVGVKSFKQQFGHVFGEDYIISAAWLGAFNYGKLQNLLFQTNHH